MSATDQANRRPPSSAPAMFDSIVHRLIQWTLGAIVRSIRLSRRFRTRRPPPRDRWRVLLTMRYESVNPAQAFVRPLASSEACESVEVVAVGDFPDIPKVTLTRPPAWLVRTCGPSAARLFVLAWRALVTRPDLIGGFHLLFNGVAAAMLSAALGSRSLYFCVGGPTEVIEGGARGENRVLGRLKRPSETIERDLLEIVRTIDLVLTMGTGAAAFFKSHGITRCLVLPGAVDQTKFHPGSGERDLDAVLVARLAPVKQPELFIQAIGRVAVRHDNLSCVIVGDGPLRGQCEDLVRDLGLRDCVQLVGHQTDVGSWLGRAKVFALTSQSEGVALAMLEAMLCGAVPVVSDVGDLHDIVAHGVNGFLVGPPSVEGFAQHILDLLTDPEKLARMRAEALQTALRYEQTTTRRRWDAIFGGQEPGILYDENTRLSPALPVSPSS